MHIVYSVTILIEEDVAAAWLEWMRTVHIPAVLATGFFTRHRLLRLTHPAGDPGLVTFNVQYDCPSQAALTQYVEEKAPHLQQDHNEKFGGSFKAFRTVLDVLT